MSFSLVAVIVVVFLIICVLWRRHTEASESRGHGLGDTGDGDHGGSDGSSGDSGGGG